MVIANATGSSSAKDKILPFRAEVGAAESVVSVATGVHEGKTQI